MSDTAILREKNPEAADFVERWRSKYQRSFNLQDPADQATFYEGVLEMARHMAFASQTASVNLDVNNNGVSSLRLSAVPLG